MKSKPQSIQQVQQSLKPVGPARRPNIGADERAATIAAVASRLFLQYGYKGVSLESIIAEAGGSYRDLYSAFGGKERLFETVLKRMCTEVLAPMKKALANPSLEALPLEEALTHVGHVVLTTILKPEAIAFHRLMVSEAPRIPEVAKFFFSDGPESANALLGSFLAKRVSKTGFALEDPHIAAAIFLDGLINNLQLKVLTGGRVSPSEVTLRVKHVVRLFLHGVLHFPEGK